MVASDNDDDRSSGDEDYHNHHDDGEGGGPDDNDDEDMTDKRYPLHDCVEFEDIDTLRNLLYPEVEDDDEDEEANEDDDDDDDDAEVGEDDDDDEDQDDAQHGDGEDHHGTSNRRGRRGNQHDGDGDDSSSDDNDSTAAAHAAAIGHSPHLMTGGGAPAAGTATADDKDELGYQQQPSAAPPLGKSNGGTTRVRDKTDESRAADRDGAAEQPALERSLGPSEARPVETATAGPSDAPEQASQQQHTGPVPSHDDSAVAPAPMDVDTDKTESEQPGSLPPESTDGTDATSVIDTKDPAKTAHKGQLNPDILLNERDDDENTAVHIAIHGRKLEHLRLLLEAGASFRIRCDGSCAVHTAISMGALGAHRQFAYECLALLHEYRADLTVKDDSLHTPLFLACLFNLPQIASFILSDKGGLSTLNARGDRVGNRPLHAAAKFDTLENPSFSKSAAATATGLIRSSQPHHHHPDGTVISAMHSIPQFPGKMPNTALSTASSAAPVSSNSTEALLTQVLLGTSGAEVDAVNSLGQTPLHVACARGNWPVARLLLQAGASTEIVDRRGHKPGHLAHKRGMPIPNDLVNVLGDPPESGVLPPPRDLIIDPHGSTVVVTHELCLLHRTCPPIRRNAAEPPPENVRRLHVLLDKETGILRTGEFASLVIKDQARRAAIADVLKVHEYSYVESISQMSSSIPDYPNAVAHLDPDTTLSRWSFEAAMRAAGAICEAVDKVVAGECRNAFCAIRPPGHHAGPRGLVKCPNDPEGGSHGFCLLNNVAIGAAYARSMYRNEGIRKVAIVDFDVHHGNGTEEIIRNLVPTTEKSFIRTPFVTGELTKSSYRPWLDETDVHNVFFSSTHGYGQRGFEQPGWFYPASGKTHISEALTHPAMVESPNLTDFILSQTWSRMGEESKANCCKIINLGLELPDPDIDQVGRNMKQRLELRDAYRKKILPRLREFDPDLIFVSAGFDAHRKDTMNFGYLGMVEDDYEWVTEQLIKVANTCCNGRLISVLEGGYKVHGGIVSPFARSVAGHVRALVDGGRSRELYDARDGEWESHFERHIYERRERKKEHERDQLRLMEEANRQTMLEQCAGGTTGETPEDPDAPSRKRRRNQVDYKELFRLMQQEGFAG